MINTSNCRKAAIWAADLGFALQPVERRVHFFDANAN